MSARERERARLVSLAAMHCRHCLTHSHTDNNDTYTEPEVDVDPDSLASLTRQLLRHSRLQLRRAEQLLATLRACALLDQHQEQHQEQHQHQHQEQHQEQEQHQHQCCGLAEQLQRSARRRLATLRREVDGAAGCCGWAESARAKLRLNTAETLTDVFGDVDVTALPLVPATVAPLEFAPPCRRASATRLKQALRCQLDAERERAKQLEFAALKYAEISPEVLQRHRHLLEQRQLLASSLTNSTA